MDLNTVFDQRADGLSQAIGRLTQLRTSGKGQLVWPGDALPLPQMPAAEVEELVASVRESAQGLIAEAAGIARELIDTAEVEAQQLRDQAQALHDRADRAALTALEGLTVLVGRMLMEDTSAATVASIDKVVAEVRLLRAVAQGTPTAT